jgi:hypothetical protein
MASLNKNLFLYNNTKYLEKRKKLSNSTLNINEYVFVEKNINREELNNFNKISNKITNSSNENKLYELIKKLESGKALFLSYLKSYEKNGVIKNNDTSSEGKKANIALLKYIINELNIKDIESIRKLINIIFLILHNYLENTNEILLKKRCNKILNLINKNNKNNKKELKLPEIIIPNSKIEFNKFTDIVQYYSDFSIFKREFQIDVTHFYLDINKGTNYFYGLYYYDSKNKNEENISEIKKALSSYLKKKKNKYEENLKKHPENNNAKNLYNNVNNCLEIINSESFWNEDKYFIISKINFQIKDIKHNIEIVTFNGMLLKKGNGHLMLCILLQLFFTYKKYRSYEIYLTAANVELANKYYKKIGFDCKNKSCKANIDQLINKCSNKYNNSVYKSEFKLILEKDNKFTNNLEGLI